MSTSTPANITNNFSSTLQTKYNICDICADTLLGLETKKTGDRESNEESSALHEKHDVCNICLGVIGQAISAAAHIQATPAFNNGSNENILNELRKALDPYMDDDSSDDDNEHVRLRIASEAPSIGLPGELALRAHAMISLVKDEITSDDNIGCPTFTTVSQYMSNVKDVVKCHVREALKRTMPYAQFCENSANTGQQEDGVMNLHIIFHTSRYHRQHQPPWSVLNLPVAKKTRKRFRGKDPTLKQGGDPRANLEKRIEAEDRKLLNTGGNNSFNAVGICDLSLTPSSGVVLRALAGLNKAPQPQHIEKTLREWFRAGARVAASNGGIDEVMEKKNQPTLKPCSVSIAAWRTPFYIGGRYTKSRRDISQTPFYVVDCGATVRKGVSSVEEQICPILSEACGSISTINNLQDDDIVLGLCKFHASGREDMDVLMMASDGPTSGRPFICEVIDAYRKPTQSKLADAVLKINCIDKGDVIWTGNMYGKNENGVGVDSLSFTSSSRYSGLQKETEDKIKHYKCVCWSERAIPSQDYLDNLLTTDKATALTQATPIRVLHRRSSADRLREILRVRAVRTDEHWFELYCSTSAGTYVKEFVHGDMGRTRPSVSVMLDCKTDIVQLDCVGIQFDK